jgi:DNA-binding NtrC family response regulator
MKKGSILVVDDNKNYREILMLLLLGQYNVQGAPSGKDALELLARQNYEMVLLDVLMPGLSGMETLQTIKLRWPDTEVIMITVIADSESIVEAIRLGAHDYVIRGSSHQEILHRIDNLFEQIQSRKRIKHLSQNSEGFLVGNMLIGPSAATQELFGELNQIASGDDDFLIFGEAGSGKSMAAAYVHQKGKRSDKPLINVPIRDIEDDNFEKALCGFERPDTNGIPVIVEGKIELADGGALVLDGIGNLSLENQAKLFRILALKSYSRIGSTRVLPVECRVIAVTTYDLPHQVTIGMFRKDLYQLLADKRRLRIPSLRERKEDIQLLAQHFVQRVAKKYGKSVLGITPQVSHALAEAPWKGNIRELAHLLEKVVIEMRGPTMEMFDLPIDVLLSSCEQKTDEILIRKKEALEKHLIQRSLIKNRFNRSKTARELGIPVETLRYRIWKLGITKDSANAV